MCREEFIIIIFNNSSQFLWRWSPSLSRWPPAWPPSSGGLWNALMTRIPYTWQWLRNWKELLYRVGYKSFSHSLTPTTTPTLITQLIMFILYTTLINRSLELWRSWQLSRLACWTLTSRTRRSLLVLIRFSNAFFSYFWKHCFFPLSSEDVAFGETVNTSGLCRAQKSLLSEPPLGGSLRWWELHAAGVSGRCPDGKTVT